MSGRNDHQENDFDATRWPLIPIRQAHNLDDDRGSRAPSMEHQSPETSNRPASWDMSTKEPVKPWVSAALPIRNRSKPQEPSPPPINRRRSTHLNEQQGDPPQTIEAPDVDLVVPSRMDLVIPSHSYGGLVADRRRSRLSTLVAGFRRSVSESSARRLSSYSGVLGDNVYRYIPLGAENFRLVRVLAARSSQVKCEILHRPFGDPPSYIAISYAWGDPSDTTKILIKHEHSPVFVQVRISKSLYHALEALRKKGEDLLVWADALSIDQQNRDEKNEQLSLMADIYKKARYTAVWLGPEEDDSDLATTLLQDVAAAAMNGSSSIQVKNMFSSGAQEKNAPALAALFEREYWNRLWVVQEIFNASSIYVYCGSSKNPLPWAMYQTASRIFHQYKRDLEDLFPRIHSIASHKQYSYSQILAYSGPGSLPELDWLSGLGDEALLEVLRVCRGKLSSDPKDKVFGVLGVLGEDIRKEFAIDYAKSVKDVYTDVVDFLLMTTDRLDVICEAIHFPVHTSSANLPTWVPDWSHIPATSTIALFPGTNFAASRDTKANYRFLGERRNRLQISAVPLGSISRHGIPVGTLCTMQDYLMAFLNWRALFLQGRELEYTLSVQETFCETICFGQIPPKWKEKGRQAWMEASLHVFACLILERLPRLAIDTELASYIDVDVGLMPEGNRRFLQDHFGSRMMGRCFCLTNQGRTGLGTGFMAPNDEVVVPLGCSTPVLIRPEGNRGEFRFVGDVYIDDYMHGKAMDDVDSDKRRLRNYIIH